jgi:putative oxidoreductase
VEVSLRFLDRLQPLALLALRVTLGVIMLAHGSIKVHRHMSEFASYIASLGLPLWLGYASAFTEFVGGILLITGTFTRLAAFFVFLNMCVAIGKVHWQHGLLGAGGYEFALALCTMAFALVFYGAGPISIDAIRSGGISRRKSK